MNTIQLPSGDGNLQKKRFEGTPWNSFVAMHYLNHKHKNHCVIVPRKNKPNEHTDISIRWIQTKGYNGYLKVPDNFWVELKKHLSHSHSHDKRFIVFPFGFSCAESGGHANIMLYDQYTKTLERFDSLGDGNSKCLNVKDLDKKILKLFKEKMGDDFVKEYLTPFGEHKIFQELQDAENKRKLPTDPEYGFCSAWACWWADVRLHNPAIHRDELIVLALEEIYNIADSLTDFIRNYSQNIVHHSKVVQERLNIVVPDEPIVKKKRRSKSKRKSKKRSKSRR
jgi:hypothetical protein